MSYTVYLSKQGCCEGRIIAVENDDTQDLCPGPDGCCWEPINLEELNKLLEQ
jgi:hypothetical protein